MSLIIRRKAAKILTATRVFVEVGNAFTNQADNLEINVNNVGDLGAAKAKGYGTGATLGLAGSEVVDGYQIHIIYTAPGKPPVAKNYEHELHTTVGAHSAPKGMIKVPKDQGFDRVLEDVLLNCIRDLQKEDAL